MQSHPSHSSVAGSDLVPGPTSPEEIDAPPSLEEDPETESSGVRLEVEPSRLEAIASALTAYGYSLEVVNAVINLESGKKVD